MRGNKKTPDVGCAPGSCSALPNSERRERGGATLGKPERRFLTMKVLGMKFNVMRKKTCLLTFQF